VISVCNQNSNFSLSSLNLQSIVCLAVLGVAAAGLLPAAYVADPHHGADYYVNTKHILALIINAS
jgi:hypothetical protein